MTYALAPSLVALRAEVNARWPSRDKTSDGWIGDAAHQTRPSDHNPGARDLVHAFDLDEDIDGDLVDRGAELMFLAEHFRQIQDPRIKYVIYESRMFSSYAKDQHPAWAWRSYGGANLHLKHMHISILSTVAAEQDTRPWLRIPATTTTRPTTPTSEDEDTMHEIKIAHTDLSAFLVAGLLVDEDGNGKPLRTDDPGGAGAFRAVAAGHANATQLDVVQRALARARAYAAAPLAEQLGRIELYAAALQQIEAREEQRDLAAGG